MMERSKTTETREKSREIKPVSDMFRYSLNRVDALGVKGKQKARVEDQVTR